MYDPRNTHTQLTSEITLLRGWILQRLRRTFSNVSSEEHEDAVQDALLKMIEHKLLNYLNTRQLALAWLWKVARNRLLTILRDRRDLMLPDSFDAGVEDVTISDLETKEFIESVLSNLQEHERKIFVLLLEGLSIKETAAALGRKIHTVHIQHERGIEKLRKIYTAKKK